MLAIRPFIESDVSLFTDWFNALPGNNVWTVDWIRQRTVEHAMYDPDLMIAATHGRQPIGFLLSAVVEDTGWILAFIVRRDQRRRGTGRALFEAAHQALHQRGIRQVTVGWAPGNYLLPGVDISYTPAIVFLERLGYRTSRETRVNMEVRLADREFDTHLSETRLRALGVTVRRGHPEDRVGLSQLCEAHGNLLWIRESAEALKREQPTLFVAHREGELCAFAAHSVCGPAGFGPMLTSAELRGLGIGTVLLKRCLQDWQRQGKDRCEIVWAGPLAFYARAVGANMGRGFWVYQRSLAES